MGVVVWEERREDDRGAPVDWMAREISEEMMLELRSE